MLLARNMSPGAVVEGHVTLSYDIASKYSNEINNWLG